MNAQLAFFAVDIAIAFAAALVAARVLTQRPRLPAAQLVAFIALNAICDVILGRADYGYWIEPALRFDIHGIAAVIFNLARNLTPFLFAALCYVLYAERRPFPWWLAALLALQLFLEEPVHLLIAPNASYARLITQTAPALLQTLFIAIALYWTLADWRNDLIEARRRTRLLITVVIGADVLLSGLLPRVLVDPDTIASFYVHVALNVSHLALLVFVLFQLMNGDIDAYLDPLRPPPATPKTPSADPDAPALARLSALMEQDHLYRRPGLTLAELAARAGLPEYRLRRLIHEQLGFANFNAYLHSWRIREACAHLRDPEMRRTPILTIALSVGYQSINTFNRGFRDVMGTTPSQWRSDEAASPPENTSPKTA
ncbi:MAG TPA: helix-turn-helix transcriptional regulator [Rhizomicrobium sp.]|nr:helix-turn-helix transcriptional regulator [Rhizomicrobium sp.]